MANTAKIEELLQPILQAHNAYLVDLQIRGDRRMKIIEIFVDTDDGISADRCADISREIAPILDSSGEFPGRHNIVVSSPGLDRPLKFLQQYRRNIGRTVSVLFDAGEGQRSVQGELIGVEPDAISIRREEDQTDRIPMDGIIRTLVVPRW